MEVRAFLSGIAQGTKSGATILSPRANGKANNGNTSILSRQRNPKLSIRVTGKVIMTFFVSRGPLLVDFLKHGATINEKRYADTATRRAIKSKRPGMLSDGVILLHDNTRPHTANLVRISFRDLAGKHFNFSVQPRTFPLRLPDFWLPEERHSWTSVSFGRRSARVGEVVDPSATYLFLQDPN